MGIILGEGITNMSYLLSLVQTDLEISKREIDKWKSGYVHPSLQAAYERILKNLELSLENKEILFEKLKNIEI